MLITKQISKNILIIFKRDFFSWFLYIYIYTDMSPAYLCVQGNSKLIAFQQIKISLWLFKIYITRLVNVIFRWKLAMEIFPVSSYMQNTYAEEAKSFSRPRQQSRLNVEPKIQKKKHTK